MSSPFPGMDPYLESAEFWSHVHLDLCSAIARSLNQSLPQGYLAKLQERLYVVFAEHAVFPDVTVSRPYAQRKPAGAGSAIAEEDAPIILSIPHETIREAYVEILRKTQGSPYQVVTTIEVLSPANKMPGEGSLQYIRKQSEVLASDVSLLEIDLLRGGAHTAAPPLEFARLECGPFDSLISLSRSISRWDFELWPIPLRNRLPRVSVPLADSDADCSLDLQSVFDAVYDAGPFARGVDYTGEADPPLKGQDAVWADTLLKEKGLRTLAP